MNKTIKYISKIGGLFGCVLVSACIQNSGHYSSGIEGTGDTVPTVSAKGTVTKLGSIYVNGIHFHTDDAQVMVDGEIVMDDQIHPGMVVSVQGEPGSDEYEAQAKRITFDYDAEGPVSLIEVDEQNRRILTVLGHEFSISEEVVIEGGNIDAIALGTFVAISGIVNKQGDGAASRVHILADRSKVALVGSVILLENNPLILVGRQAVDFSQAALVNGAREDLVAGVVVKVKGTLAADGQTLLATDIRFLKEVEPEKKSVRSEEGFITAFDSKTQFELNGFNVDVSSVTVVSGGTLTDLANDRRVSVTGSIGADGVLHATNLHIYSTLPGRFSGRVTALDLASWTITLDGIVFVIDQHTAFDDLYGFKNRYFDLKDVRVGDQLDIYSYVNQGRRVVTSIKRKMDVRETFQLRGRISRLVDVNSFYVQDLLVHIDNVMDAQMNNLTLGATVLIEGELIGAFEMSATHIIVIQEGCFGEVNPFCPPPRRGDVRDLPPPKPPRYKVPSAYY